MAEQRCLAGELSSVCMSAEYDVEEEREEDCELCILRYVAGMPDFAASSKRNGRNVDQHDAPSNQCV